MSQLHHGIRARMAMALSNISNPYTATEQERIMHEINWKDLIYLLNLQEIATQLKALVTGLKPCRTM